jgi:hypothetical protein
MRRRCKGGQNDRTWSVQPLEIVVSMSASRPHESIWHAW